MTPTSVGIQCTVSASPECSVPMREAASVYLLPAEQEGKVLMASPSPDLVGNGLGLREGSELSVSSKMREG